MGVPTTTGLPPAFRRFWWGEAVSGLGTAASTLALQTVVLVTLGGSATQVGWPTSARWLPYLVLGLVVGALVDQVRRRPVMVATDLVRALLLAVVPLAWALDVLSLPLLLGVVVLLGTASLVNDAASLSFVPRLVAGADLQRAHARLDAAAAVAQTGGPALAGGLVRLLGAPLTVLVDALGYLVSAVAVATLRDVEEPEPARRTTSGLRGLRDEVVEGARWAYGGSGLRPLAVATHVWFAGQAVLVVVVVPYGYGPLGLGSLQLGLVLAVAGVGAVVGAWVSTAVGRRLGSGGAVVCSYAVSALGVVVVLAAGSVADGWPAAGVLALGQLAHGWAMGLSNSHEMAVRQTRTPDRLQARTNTTLRSLNRAVLVVVPPVAGLLADQLGARPVLAAGGVAFGAAALLVLASPIRTARVG